MQSSIRHQNCSRTIFIATKAAFSDVKKQSKYRQVTVQDMYNDTLVDKITMHYFKRLVGSKASSELDFTFTDSKHKTSKANVTPLHRISRAPVKQLLAKLDFNKKPSPYDRGRPNTGGKQHAANRRKSDLSKSGHVNPSHLKSSKISQSRRTSAPTTPNVSYRSLKPIGKCSLSPQSYAPEKRSTDVESKSRPLKFQPNISSRPLMSAPTTPTSNSLAKFSLSSPKDSKPSSPQIEPLVRRLRRSLHRNQSMPAEYSEMMVVGVASPHACVNRG